MSSTDIPNYENLNKLLNEKIYTSKFVVGITKQTLTRWQQSSFIEDTRHTDKGWTKFSLIDILWMGIIIELRDYDISIENIVKIKKYLFSLNESYKSDKLKNIDWATIQVITYAHPIFFVTNATGEFHILDDIAYVNKLQLGEIRNHLVLSLNQLIKVNIEALFTEPDFSLFKGLSKDEIQVLLILRSENYLSVTITKRNGTIDTIEGTQRISQKDKIVSILQEHDYQDIEIKQAGGKIVHITRTVKKKLAKS